MNGTPLLLPWQCGKPGGCPPAHICSMGPRLDNPEVLLSRGPWAALRSINKPCPAGGLPAPSGGTVNKTDSSSGKQAL